MCGRNIALTRQSGQPWTLQVVSPEWGGLDLCLFDDGGQECVRAAIQPIGGFYQILLPNRSGSRKDPFVGWAEGQERLDEILPQYHPVLPVEAQELLTHPIIGALRVREFYHLLYQAALTNRVEKGRGPDDEPRLVFDLSHIHIQPRMIQALLRIFPVAEAGSRQVLDLP
ncbi:MAG: hypothetical protein V9G20_13115 [Candidatus Promineifilaceae bacterium]